MFSLMLLPGIMVRSSSMIFVGQMMKAVVIMRMINVIVMRMVMTLMMMVMMLMMMMMMMMVFAGRLLNTTLALLQPGDTFLVF